MIRDNVITNNSHLRSRYEALKSARKTVEGQWQEIERYVAPYRGEFFTTYTSEHQIRWNRHEIYESTALNSSKRLAANIQSGMTNPMVRWFDLLFRDAKLNSGPPREWLEDCAEREWQAISESNFALESNEAYLDIVTFGTAVVMEDAAGDGDEWEGIDFQTAGMRDSYFEEDHRGNCLRYYRRLEWKYHQIVDKFGEEGLPESLRTASEGGKDVDQRHELFMVIYPRVPNADKVEYDGPKAPKMRPWGQKYILLADASQLGEEFGYYEMPVFVIRWAKTSGSQWGNGPAATAMPDIKTLNELVQLDLRAREKVIDPAILVTERGLIGDLDLGPAGINVVRSLEEMAIFESRARFDAVNDKVFQLQENIRNLFYIPDMILKESPAMTATEVMERREQMHRVMGPAAGRLQDDFLDKMLQRTFNMMYRAGQFLPMPEGLEATNLDIEYLGPLARSQRNERISAVTTWLGIMGELTMVDPSAKDVMNLDEVGRDTGEMLGVPASMIRSEEEVGQIRKARMEAQQQVADAQLAQERGAGMEAVGKGQQALTAVGGGGGGPAAAA